MVNLHKLITLTPIKVTGDSMIPLLFSNDILEFRKIIFKNVETDDIVLIKKGRQNIVHRVIYINSQYAITKGDNNPDTDGKIKPREIVGKVVSVRRDGEEFSPDSLYLIQSSFYLKQIIKLKRALDRKGIKYVFLKGLPLHFLYQKRHPRRIYSDCDILIEKKDFSKVSQIFAQNGYATYDKSLTSNKLADNESPEVTFTKTSSGFPVHFDIHTEAVFLMTQLGSLNALYPEKMVDRLTSEMLATRKITEINGEKLFILNEKYFVIYLALHYFHHNFNGIHRLRFLNIVVRTIRFDSAAWSQVVAKINEFRLGNFVYPVLILAKKYFDTPIPDIVFSNIEADRDLCLEVIRNTEIFDREDRISSGIRRFKNIFYLSPYSTLRKLLAFTDPRVIYFALFSLKKKLFYFLGVHR